MSTVLRTDRLVLRQLEERDRDAFRKLNSDPEVMQYLGPPLSTQASDALFARIFELIEAQGWSFWAAEVLAEGKFIGFVGLHRPDYVTPFTPCLEVGWRLQKRSWGQGYATEGARAALDFAFSHLDDQEVVSFTSLDNWRSRKVMERLGLRRDPDGDFDHPKLPEGDPLRPHVLYRIAKQQWRA